MSTCPICNRRLVKAYGYSRSDILIVGDEPSINELQTGVPFSGETGKVLRKEMARVGMDLGSCRIMNLWTHKAWKKSDEHFDECFEMSRNLVLDEAKGKQAILLIGADTVQYFTGYKVSDVNGLQVESNMLSAPVIFAAIQPTNVFRGGWGEVRFAIEQFVHHVKKGGII